MHDVYEGFEDKNIELALEEKIPRYNYLYKRNNR